MILSDLLDDEVTVCIGCGCDDLHACDVDEDGNACHWLRIDEDELVGVCSECPEHVTRFDAGERSIEYQGQAGAPADRATEEESLLLPGDAEYGQVLSYLRDRTPPR
ncbi:MAG TPA: hypothetical protein VFX20_17950 [Steroidobacteraceae bacterium]|nr:hypothetical protein [Steroidobacteraceae bacterium]